MVFRFPALPRFLLLTALLGLHQLAAQDQPQVQYRALSEAAAARGQLARYDKASCTTVRLRADGVQVVAQVPKMVRAYDVVPIRYTVTAPPAGRRVAVEATAFEDSAKTKGKKFYDLSVPGDTAVKVEYLGSVSGDIREKDYVPLTGSGKDPVSPYPIFTNDPLVRSGEIKAADLVWYKWRLTNTGDTILDPEGFAACMGEPRLTKLGPDGKEEWTAQALNHYVRFLNYLYPGESTELWTVFYTPKNAPAYLGMQPGNYRLDFLVLLRMHRTWLQHMNVWGGYAIARSTVPLTVTEKGGMKPVKEDFQMLDTGEKMPGYIDAFEEFMTAFNIHREETKEGVVHLQVAPWTREIKLKLILDKPMTIDVASVPVLVSQETLAIKPNPSNPMMVGNDPAFLVQAMPGMRSGIQLGPEPEKHLRAELQEMKNLGVNVIVNTAGDWWVPELAGRQEVISLAAQYKYYYDVLAREEGVKLMGWSVYPTHSNHWYGAPAAALLKKPAQAEPADARYEFTKSMVDLGDPLVPEVIAAFALHNHRRWGDLYFQTRDGVTPISIEDTWGWLRDDINIRYPLGKIGLQRFRDWVKEKYQTIEAANAAWGSNYAGFEAIDPQADQGSEAHAPSLAPVFNKPNHPFRDWSPAMADFDRFRTWLRMDNYEKALTIVRQEIPGAKWELRTEGGNMTVAGDAESPSMHRRHLFYSQRRNAMVNDMVKAGDLIGFYSDYTTLPYTDEEFADGVKEMAAQGIRPTFLPTFNDMRDILINPHYGRDYQTSYGLAAPAQGMMIHCLMAAYPWWKMSYEAGGAPGIIWADYLCDAFATETQKRELGLLTQHFRRMK